MSHLEDNGQSIQLYSEVLSEYEERLARAREAGDDEKISKIEERIEYFKRKLNAEENRQATEL